MKKRLITNQMIEEDITIETSLRPSCLDDYIGQEKAKENIRIF